MSGVWLALDTATDIASVAAGRPPTVEAGSHIQGARRYAAEILRLIDVTLGRLAPAAAAGALPLGPVPVAACFDALRGQVYGAEYVIHPDRVDTLVAPAVCTVEELAGAAPAVPRLVVGDGAVRYAEAVVRWCGASPVPLEALPPAASLLLALFQRIGAGRPIPDLATAEPVYGRPAEAQARWEARHGRPLPDPSGPAR